MSNTPELLRQALIEGPQSDAAISVLDKNPLDWISLLPVGGLSIANGSNLRFRGVTLTPALVSRLRRYKSQIVGGLKDGTINFDWLSLDPVWQLQRGEEAFVHFPPNPEINLEDTAYIYDAEIFKNYTHFRFKGEQSGEVYDFVCTPYINHWQALRKFFEGRLITLISFNGAHYDDPILETALKGPVDSYQLYLVSQAIIGEGQSVPVSGEYFNTIDVFQIKGGLGHAAGAGCPSLKALEVRANWHNVQDLPLSYHAYVQPEQIGMMVDYCENDVDFLEWLYHHEENLITSRQEIGAMYSANFLAKSDSAMGIELVEEKWVQAYGSLPFVPSMPSHVRALNLPELDFIEGDLRRVYERAQSEIFYPNHRGSFKFDEVTKSIGPQIVDLEPVYLRMGVGGLHSIDKAKFLDLRDSSDVLVDIDVSSFYPYIILNQEIEPGHIKKGQFLTLYRGLVEARINAKLEGDYTTANIMKIMINALFGRLNSPHSWLYSPHAFLSVTLSGQLYLCHLIEKVMHHGYQVESANTDGIFVRCHYDDLGKLETLVNGWGERHNFDLDFSTYETYLRKDVNNYTLDSGAKTKGVFSPQGLRYAVKFPIVYRAIVDHFTRDISPEETIVNEQNIYEFVMSLRSNPKTFVNRMVDNEGQITELPRTIRYVVSGKGQQIYKERADGSKIRFTPAKLPKLLINLVNEEVNIAEYSIDYPFYLKQAQDVIKKINEGYLSPTNKKYIERVTQ